MKDDYTIVRKIGAGGFGQVYLAVDSKGGKFAIKMISNLEPTKYTLNELRIISGLNHPRVTKLIEHYRSANAYNFVLEYAERGSLRSFLLECWKSKRILLSMELIQNFTDIVQGVKYLHKKSIIHRDLKPENILLFGDGRLKLTDFGVSKMIHGSKRENHTVIGTPSYMAPEVLLFRLYDKSSDIWALGLLLYELAFIKDIFNDRARARIVDDQIPYKCPIIDWKSRGYGPQLQRLLEMMLQRMPSHRSTCDEILIYLKTNENLMGLEPENKQQLDEKYANRKKVVLSFSVNVNTN